MENKNDVMIDVDHVTIRFNLANQKIDNLKEYFIKMFFHILFAISQETAV